nr:FtsX-like permease family protein [Acidobacteriota bacterium]
TTERRSKEIGIRKAIGASSWSIIVLLTVEFSKLVLFANVLAWPVAYYIMRGWLNNFAYRITPHPLIFIFGALIAFIIAWATVGGLSARAATARPVNVLRSE